MDRQISIIEDSICESSHLGQSNREDWAALVIGFYKSISYQILSASTDVGCGGSRTVGIRPQPWYDVTITNTMQDQSHNTLRGLQSLASCLH